MRLIDADELTYNEMVDIHGDFCLAVYASNIDNAPTIKTESVVHGKWDRFNLYICSACKNTASFRFDYCPNCGAKMDKQEKYECGDIK